jgi:hypothetical protein
MSTAPLQDSSFLGLEGLHVFVTGAAGETQIVWLENYTIIEAD